MRTLSWLLKAAVLSLLIAQPACAEKKTAPAAPAETAIRAALTKQFPRHKVGDIRKSPLPGVYEVVIGREVVYSDAAGKYVFFGDLVNVAKQESLTELRKTEIMKGAFKDLPLEAAIKVVRGKGERQVAVFTDPDCPFCKQLDQEKLKPIDNVTIYYFLLPLDQLHPDARRKSTKVWCAPDRVKAWYDLIYENKEPENDGKCETPLERVAEEARSLGFSGTPGLMFPDGTRVPGAIPTEKIEELLEASKPSKS